MYYRFMVQKPMVQLRILLDDGQTALGMYFDYSKLRFHADHNLSFDDKQGAIMKMEVTCLAIKSPISAEHGRVFDCLVLRFSGQGKGTHVRVGKTTCIDSPVESKRVFTRVFELRIV